MKHLLLTTIAAVLVVGCSIRRKILGVILLAVLLLWVVTTIYSADSELWPSYRHDASRSGISPLVGGLAKVPAVAWTVDLGGKMYPGGLAYDLDTDQDGEDEVILVNHSSVVCQNPDGSERWSVNNLPQAKLIHYADFHASGRKHLMVETNNHRLRSIYCIDSRTGKYSRLFSWHSAFGTRTGVGSLMRGGGYGKEQFYALWDGWNPSGNGQIMHFYLFTTDSVTQEPKKIHHIVEEGNIFGAQFIVTDIDRTGSDDLIFISMEQAWAFDLTSGTKIAHFRWQPGIRSYSSYTGASQQEDGIVLTMINPHIPGLQSITLGDDGMAHRRWKTVIGGVEDQYQQELKISPACPDPIVDLDGDGRSEILTEISNEYGDQESRLVIFDADDGRRIHESAVKIVTIDDLDADGKPEILLRKNNSTQIARWNGTELKLIGKEIAGEPILEARRRSGFNRNAPGEKAFVNQSVIREKNLLVFKDGSQTSGYYFGEDGLKKVVPFSFSPRNSRPPGRLDYRVHSRRKSYMPPPALVGRFGDKPSILLRDAKGTLITFGPDGNKEREWIGHSPSHPHNYENHFSQAEICDIDGDGSNDLITTTASGTEGKGRIVVFDSEGREQLSIPPIPGAREVCFGATGQIEPGGPRWITAAYRLESMHPVEAAYHGKTSAELWRRENYADELVRFGYPCATFDYDGDGSDDMVVSAGNFFGILNVATNRHLVGPVKLGPTHLPGHWSTRFRTILVPRREMKPDVFLHRNNGVTASISLEGNYRWHYSLYPRDNMPFNQEGIADLDGDGSAEIITAHRDGTLRAFSNSPAAGKCPTCKKDAPITTHNHAGELRWEFKIPGPVNPSVYRSDQDFASADLDADGRMELLIGGGDGVLYALEESAFKCRIKWEIKLSDRRIGSPVLADLDADGRAEILVPDEGGTVYCLRGDSDAL